MLTGFGVLESECGARTRGAPVSRRYHPVAQCRCGVSDPGVGIRQMRKWCLWYTAGFRGAAVIRPSLLRIDSLERMQSLLGRLDPAEPFPQNGLRASKAKDGRRQEVRLPHGYLATRDDDAPPVVPDHALEAALDGG